MMELFDSHCHVDEPKFDSDRDEALLRMSERGVTRYAVIGSDMASSRHAADFAKAHEGCYAAVGIHPHEAKTMKDGDLDLLAAWLREEKVVALGEIGLDYYYDLSPRDVQRDAFARQLELAYALDKPVILHIRDAHGDTIDLLRAHKNRLPQCVVHCCSASWESAKVYLGLGCMISFAGPVTLARSVNLHEVAKNMPLDRMMIETDSPYLAPEPVRGRRNDPRNVAYICAFIAQLRGMDAQALCDVTRENGKRFYGIR